MPNNGVEDGTFIFQYNSKSTYELMKAVTPFLNVQ